MLHVGIIVSKIDFFTTLFPYTTLFRSGFLGFVLIVHFYCPKNIELLGNFQALANLLGGWCIRKHCKRTWHKAKWKLSTFSLDIREPIWTQFINQRTNMKTIQCLKPVHSGQPHKTHDKSDLKNFTQKLEQGYEGDLKNLENNMVHSKAILIKTTSRMNLDFEDK